MLIIEVSRYVSGDQTLTDPLADGATNLGTARQHVTERLEGNKRKLGSVKICLVFTSSVNIIIFYGVCTIVPSLSLFPNPCIGWVAEMAGPKQRGCGTDWEISVGKI